MAQAEPQPFHRPKKWPPEPGPEKAKLLARATAPVVLSGTEQSAAVPVTRDVITGFKAAAARSAPDRVVLAIECITLDRAPGGSIDVYITPGKAGSSATPVNVGTLDFFTMFGEYHDQQGLKNAWSPWTSTFHPPRSKTAAGDTLTVSFKFHGPVSVSDRRRCRWSGRSRSASEHSGCRRDLLRWRLIQLDSCRI